MSLSVVDLYKDVLPKTNCGDCGFPTCLAFAGMVVSEMHPLADCPHLGPDSLETYQSELNEQYASGKWLKRDMAQDALEWAKERAASMKIEDLPDRIGGKLIYKDNEYSLELQYFTGSIIITNNHISKPVGSDLTRWEQVFIYNHMAQGGTRSPTGHWKGFGELPNTVSKVISMNKYVEAPLIEEFKGKPGKLLAATERIGGLNQTAETDSADLSLLFNPLPRIPIMLLFWDEDQDEGFEAQVKLLFDATVTEHLDIESIVFLSERLGQLLCEALIT